GRAWEFVRAYLLEKRSAESARARKKLLRQDPADCAALARRLLDHPPAHSAGPLGPPRPRERRRTVAPRAGAHPPPRQRRRSARAAALRGRARRVGLVAVRPRPRAGHAGRRRPPRAPDRPKGSPIPNRAPPRPRSGTDEAAACMAGDAAGGPRHLARPAAAPTSGCRGRRATGHLAGGTAQRARPPVEAGDGAEPPAQGRRAHLTSRARASRTRADGFLERNPWSPGTSLLPGRRGGVTGMRQGEKRG